MKRFAIILALLAVVPAGCGNDGHGGRVARAGADHDRAPASNVWSGQLRTLDRAKGVQQTLMKSARRRGQEIDRQSGE